MDNKELRRKIETFSLDDGDLGSQGYERVLLQLFGYAGHGKSSFINSCRYVLDDGGSFIEYAQAGQRTDGGSLTMIRKSYPLTPNITIVDNRGLRAMTELERAEVYAQLGNFYPLNKKVEWKENFNEAMSALEESEKNPNYSDFLVPIFIYSGRQVLGGQEEKDVKELLDNCVLMTGVVPIVVITHKSSGNYCDAEKKFRLLGAEVVISIEIYSKANQQKTQQGDNDILSVIDAALDNVGFRVDQPRNPRADRIERKKFLLEYFHRAVVNQERERREHESLYFTILREAIERAQREPGEHYFNFLKIIGGALMEPERSCTIQ